MTPTSPDEPLPSGRATRLGDAKTATRTRTRTAARQFRHPLTAICIVQAVASLALVWSNTAYIDEADYLWVGHLVLSHWFHGTPWPAGLVKSQLSGSPFIYPPIGALADSLGGLAGARILSLLLMLGATLLLYSTSARILGRRAALFAAFFWAVSEPALRLTYATFDPLSVFLTTLSAWLAVQAAYRRRRVMLAAAAAVALAMANAAAFSGIVIDPVVIGFAVLVWYPVMSARRVLIYAASFTGGLVVSFGLVMSATGSWTGTTTVFHRQSQDHESIGLVIGEIWGYSGFIMALAMIGVIVAIKVENRQRALLLALLGFAVLAAPLAQLHYGTTWSADKHVAYGFWFAAMAAGYGGAKLVSWPAGTRTRLISTCCAVAMIYPTVYGFTAAWQRYHEWPNAAPFVNALRPYLAQTTGLIYVPGHEANIAQYYLPQGRDWQRWSSALALDPSGLPTPVPRSGWQHYYATEVGRQSYGVIALFYNTSLTTAALSPDSLTTGNVTHQALLALLAANSGEPGVTILTETLERGSSYKLAASGPYDTTTTSGAQRHGIFVIWDRVRG